MSGRVSTVQLSSNPGHIHRIHKHPGLGISPGQNIQIHTHHPTGEGDNISQTSCRQTQPSPGLDVLNSEIAQPTGYYCSPRSLGGSSCHWMPRSRPPDCAARGMFCSFPTHTVSLLQCQAVAVSSTT